MLAEQSTPVLAVIDVGRSMEWYRSTLGFTSSPFPQAPPHEFAILTNGGAEIMLQRVIVRPAPAPRPYKWNIYLRIRSERYRALYAELESKGCVLRRMEKMFYGPVEFEITDPDGYVICLSQELDDSTGIPSPD